MAPVVALTVTLALASSSSSDAAPASSASSASSAPSARASSESSESRESSERPRTPTRILVLDVAGDAVTRTQAGAIRDRLAAAVARKKNVDVLSSEDVRRVLDVEGQKQAAGCAGQSDCLAEIGAALGADGVLYASVVRLGEKLVVSLSLVDPKNARSVGRDSFEAASLDEIADDLPQSAARLFGGPVETVAKPPAPSKPFPVLTVGGAVVAGAGAIGAAAFGYATYDAQQVVSDPNAKGAQKTAALQNGPTELVATVVSAGVAGVGALVFLFGLILE